MPKHILLCIDDESIGLHIRKLLLEHSGYEVLTADSGPTGLAIFNERPVDAVVLDYFMPEMTGAEVAAAMKARKPAVPIVLLSAFLDLPAETEKSVDAFVTKGQPPEVLLETIKKVINGG